MQYLLISKTDTLQDISKTVGQSNVDLVLAENGLTREPNIGQQYYEKCRVLLENTLNDVPSARKQALLNGLTSSEEVFEKACLMDEEQWKIFSAFQSFEDALRIPESIQLPYSSRIIGSISSIEQMQSIGNVSGSSRSSGSRTASTATDVYGTAAARREAISMRTNTASASSNMAPVEPVSSETFKKVINELKNTGRIDPGVFNSVNTSLPVNLDDMRFTKVEAQLPPYAFNLPWGKIQIYSSLIQEVIDIPAYPETVETGRGATYTSMPDIIYQYEPWIVYQNSGPRTQSLSFHLHRDMWTGNHLDGNANKLIRFCEANTFPRYTGSMVNSPKVWIYIDGQCFIAGVLTECRTTWSGPIGLDNWHLEFELNLTIQEVSDVPLNIDVVRKFGIIGS